MSGGQDRRRTVLLLDFDNIFGLLLALDRAAAIRLAENPGTLLSGLCDDDPRRDILVRRAYLNPAGWLMDSELGNASGRLYLQRFRPNLVRAGFAVVDCPALTQAQKNAADIRMVLDTVDLIEHATRFDEFVIASGDADFTPVLQRLRAHDRVTTVLTAGPVALAYSAVADNLVDDSALIAMTSVESEPQQILDHIDVDSEIAAAAQDAVRELLDKSDGPINLSDLGNELHDRFGSDVIRSTNWLGFGNLGSLVAATDSDFRCAKGMAWNVSRHETPLSATEIPMPGFIATLSQLADLPRLRSEQWPLLFSTLEEYASTHEFSLTESTAWARDRISELGSRVGRQPIGFVVHGAMIGGASLNSSEPPSAEEISSAFQNTILSRAEATGIDVTDHDRDVLELWMSGSQAGETWGPPPSTT